MRRNGFQIDTDKGGHLAVNHHMQFIITGLQTGLHRGDTFHGLEVIDQLFRGLLIAGQLHLQGTARGWSRFLFGKGKFQLGKFFR